MANAQIKNFEVEPEDDESGDHPESEDIGKFFTGELTGKAHRDMEQHLASCDRCRQDLITHLRYAEAPLSEDNLQQLAAQPGMSLDEQVEFVLQQFPAQPARMQWRGRRVLEWLDDVLVSPSLAPAMAVALLVVISLAGLQTNKIYQTQRLKTEVAQGYAALREQWFVTGEDFRPAGNFPRTIFSHARGVVANAAELEFQQALRRAPESREARLGLAVFYTFSGQLFLADSLLGILIAQDSTDSEAWNQRGLVQARALDHEAALESFAAALRHRPTYAEAAFNRAKLLTQLERKAEALQAWQDYLKLDATSAWADAARARMQNLQTP